MDSITSTEIKFSTLSKKVTDELIDQENLALKYPKRTIVDISTDTFIKTFFADNKNYYLFLNYVNLLDFYLGYLTNLELVDKSDIPYCQDENIELYFKGGNVMNYHFNKMVSDPKIKELFKDFFKKSDFDFSVSIHTEYDNRYRKLKEIAYPKIINFLKKTTTKFNDYLEIIESGGKIDASDNFKKSTFRDKNLNTKYDTILEKVKEVISHPRFAHLNEIAHSYFKINNDKFLPKITSVAIIDNYIKVIFDNNKQILYRPKLDYNQWKWDNYVIDNFNTIINDLNSIIYEEFNTLYWFFHKKSKYHACLLYPYYKYLIQYNGSHEWEYDDLLESLFNYNFYLLTSNNFYSKDKLRQLVEEIYQTLNTLTDTYYEINSDNPPDSNELMNPKAFSQYKIVRTSPNGTVKFASRADFIMYNDTESIKETILEDYNIIKNREDEFADNNIHYVSANFLIANILESGKTQDFDLFRIKCNLVAENIVSKNGKLKSSFNIPSEFIDVSVISIYSSEYNYSKMKFIMPIEIDDMYVPPIYVKTHSYDYFINDLIRILFVDAFMPWDQPKYQKRVKRMILLLYLYDIQHHTNMLSVLRKISKEIKYNLKNQIEKYDLKKYAETPVYIESYKSYKNIYDMLYISKKYNIVRYPIKFLLIMSEILKQDRQIMLKIINHFKKYSKLAPSNNVDNLKEDFIIFLNEIMESSDPLFN